MAPKLSQILHSGPPRAAHVPGEVPIISGACMQAMTALRGDLAAQRKSLQARINELSRGSQLTAGKLSEAQEEARQLRMQLAQEREQHGKVQRAGPALLPSDQPI